MDKLKLIKSIVFIMTFLLVFGSLLLLTMIYKKSKPQPVSYQEFSLEQPVGSNISSVTETDGYLAILIKGGGLADRIIIYDLQTKQKLSTINL